MMYVVLVSGLNNNLTVIHFIVNPKLANIELKRKNHFNSSLFTADAKG